ncbi:MAG: hypothetical protein H6Q25_1040 [Bacteroidetes bacterium]|nr:hypothetical protein [Bacteroidota bacterium]
MRKRSLLVIAALISLFFISCEDELTSLGLNLRDPNDLMGTSFMDSTTIVAQSLWVDSLNTKGLSSNVLGYVNDPTFGSTKADFYAQYLLSAKSVDFGTANLDSVVLCIRIGGFFGDTTTALPIRVYELDEKMNTDSVYTANSTLEYKNTNLTYDPNFTLKPKPTTRVTIDTNSYEAHIRIRLSDAIGQFFLDHESDMQTDALFAALFKGLYVTVENPNGTGSLMYINLTSSLSKIAIYYKDNNVRKEFTLLTSSSAIRFNHYEHYYTKATPHFISEVMNGVPYGGNSTLGEELLYLQPTGGVKTKIQFPTVKNAFKDKKIVINRAELVITNVSTDPTHFFNPALLTIQGVAKDGTICYLPDDSYFTSSEYFGATYNTTTKEYRIRITDYIHDLILRDNFQDYFYLMVSGSGVRGNRLIFGGTNPSDISSRLRLEISYTEY